MRWWRVTALGTMGLAGAVAVAPAGSAGAAPSDAAGAQSAWQVVPTPALTGEVDLTGVTALSPADAWAVGYVSRPSGVRTLTLHWNGIKWARIPSPNPSAERNWLTSISGSARSSVWAAGSYWNTARQRRTLLMRWTGHQWAVVPSPSVRYESLLNGVAVLSRTNAWAVGSSLTVRFSGRTLIEHWNGVSWAVVPSPSPVKSGEGSNLLAVAAASPGSIWAVGDIDAGGGVMGTLTEHWGGRSWRAVRSPSAPAGALVSSIAATSGAAWAVGWRQIRGLLQPLAIRRAGARWTVHTPPIAARKGVFAGVAVLGRHDVWAAGERGTRTLAAHWDGTSWTITPAPSPGRVYSSLVSLAAVPRTHCLWAVGSYLNNAAPPHALAERRC